MLNMGVMSPRGNPGAALAHETRARVDTAVVVDSSESNYSPGAPKRQLACCGNCLKRPR
jgi:hypothetical protein